MTIDPKKFTWEGWNFTENAVLLFLFHKKDVLLIHKLRGLGTGKVNGPGGRLEKGETFAQAAVRETLEETGVHVSQLKEAADLSFVFVDGYSLYAKVYFAYDHTGTPHATDEADPFWCPVRDIPYEKMWADDILWLPKALEGHYVMGKFIFDGDTMLTQDVSIQGTHIPEQNILEPSPKTNT